MWKYNDYNEELYHYGVLGMKWGRRKKRNTTTQTRRKNRRVSEENMHDDYKRTRDGKDVKQMSDKELRERLNRLQMEKQYKQLNPSEISKGKEFLSAAVKTAGTMAALTTTIITLNTNYGKIKNIMNKG